MIDLVYNLGYDYRVYKLYEGDGIFMIQLHSLLPNYMKIWVH